MFENVQPGIVRAVLSLRRPKSTAALIGSLLLSAQLTSIAATAACANDRDGFAVEETADGYWVREAGEPVLFYQRAMKSQEDKFARANYVHPLYDLDGRVMTEDFPADHRHHRGIFWAWHQVLVGDRHAGDAWVARRFHWDVRDVVLWSHGDGSLAIHSRVDWTSTDIDDRPIATERVEIRIYPAQPNSRAVDFRIELLARRDGVKIGGSENSKGYGGFSTRIRLPADLRFVGETGELTPRTNAVAGGGWVDMSATFGPGSAKSGMTIICHSQSAGYPQPWLLRQRGSMQNPAYPGREPVALSETKPLLLRYRLVLHRGDGDRATISRWAKDYQGKDDP